MTDTPRNHAEACMERIRHLVLTGALLPGQKLNQADLADRLGVSRVPVREALSGLSAEGLVEYRANTGFTVVRPTVEDLQQIYLMRNLLETELLLSLDIEQVDADLLERVNADMAALDPVASFEEYRQANQEFHFTLFDASPLRLVRREVARLWTLSEFYRSLYIQSVGTASRVLEEHRQIVDAVRRRDIKALVAVCEMHRQGTESALSFRLG